MSAEAAYVLQRLRRGPGVHGDAGEASGLADRREGPQGVSVRLLVEGDDVRPAFANSSTCSLGRSIIRWTSSGPAGVMDRSAIDAAIRGPIVIGGTK